MFLTLPTEIITHIAVTVGLDDLNSLFHLAQTCRPMRDLILERDDVWRGVHLALYDNPHEACAFLAPRTGYDWQQTVVDRQRLSNFLDIDVLAEDIEYVERYEWRRIALMTARGLFLDLPPPDSGPSRNASILQTMASSRLFSGLLQLDCAGLHGREGEEAMAADHITALLFPLVIAETGSVKPLTEFTRGWANFFGYRNGIGGAEKGTRWPDESTYWHGIRRCVALVHCGDSRWKGNGDEASIQTMSDPSLDAVRGPGILGLRRPHGMAPSEVWDWAGTRGEWTTIRTVPEVQGARYGGRHFRNMPDQPWEPLETFAIVPVADFQSIWAERDAKLKQWEAPTFDMTWHDSPLPPVYFVGRSGSKLMLGVVHLTPEDPPQLRWDLAVNDPQTPKKRIIFQGVQVGGRGARRGVYGTFMFHKINDISPAEKRALPSKGPNDHPWAKATRHGLYVLVKTDGSDDGSAD